MSLSALFDALKIQETVCIPAGWTQGRANYGGLVAAMLYARTQSVLPDGRELRSATVSFVAPVATAEVTVTARVLRQGKSVIQTEAHMLQNGDVVAVLLCSFGVGRESAIQVQSALAPTFKSPEDGLVLPVLPGLTPDFVQHIDFRWTHGDLPFSGSTLPEIGGWMRLKEARGEFDLLDLFLLVDAWPPTTLPMSKAPAPSSSLTWTLEPVQLPQGKSAVDWWQYLATTDYAADGYANTQAKIWDNEGRLVAISRQVVVSFG